MKYSILLVIPMKQVAQRSQVLLCIFVIYLSSMRLASSVQSPDESQPASPTSNDEATRHAVRQLAYDHVQLQQKKMKDEQRKLVQDAADAEMKVAKLGDSNHHWSGLRRLWDLYVHVAIFSFRSRGF